MTDIQADTLRLARQLIACRSITPADDGCLSLVSARLSAAGFTCERFDRGPVGNLWARHGSSGPLVCLAGHVDVVPPGPVEQWTSDPFTPTERDGVLYGRGASDMKGPVAAMVTAAERVAREARGRGSVAILLTSDEEGDAVDGTAVRRVRRCESRGETIDACIVGEPTSSEQFGDTIKNGRRGSLNGTLRVHGQQCHIAYPERGRNPIHDAARALDGTRRDRVGSRQRVLSAHQFSDLEHPRGNRRQQRDSRHTRGLVQLPLLARVLGAGAAGACARILDAHRLQYDLQWTLIGEPFITTRGPLVEAVTASVHVGHGCSAGVVDERRDIRRSLPGSACA